MHYFTVTKCLKSFFIIGFTTLLMMGCATKEELAAQPAKGVIACHNFPGLENTCSFENSQVKDFHPEYNEQLLPIHKRKEVIEQELEDAGIDPRKHDSKRSKG